MFSTCNLFSLSVFLPVLPLEKSFINGACVVNSPIPVIFMKCGPVLGIKPAKKTAAEEDDEQHEQKQSMRSSVAGFILILFYNYILI